MTRSMRENAAAFAAALDEDQFSEAAAYLADDCRYTIHGEEYVGPEAILASYEEGSARGRKLFDRVAYESEIASADENSAVIVFVDRLYSGEREHVYKLQQTLFFNEAGEIVAIKHEEFPGQREALEAFLVEIGAA